MAQVLKALFTGLVSRAADYVAVAFDCVIATGYEVFDAGYALEDLLIATTKNVTITMWQFTMIYFTYVLQASVSKTAFNQHWIHFQTQNNSGQPSATLNGSNCDPQRPNQIILQ